MTNSESNFWQNAERTNGRMAMMGFFALVVNYGLFGWIIPGIFQTKFLRRIIKIMKKNIYKKYAELLVKAENATGRDEANFLIKKAANLQNKLALSMQNFLVGKDITN